MATSSQQPFEFAVGIECTMIVDERRDTNPPMRRLEEFELMRHYDMWRGVCYRNQRARGWWQVFVFFLEERRRHAHRLAR